MSSTTATNRSHKQHKQNAPISQVLRNIGSADDITIYRYYCPAPAPIIVDSFTSAPLGHGLLIILRTIGQEEFVLLSSVRLVSSV